MWEKNGEVCWGMGKVSGMWERSGGRCGRVYEVSVEVAGKWGKVFWDVEGVKKCREGPHTLLHLPYTSTLTRHTPPTITQHLFPTPPTLT